MTVAAHIHLALGGVGRSLRLAVEILTFHDIRAPRPRQIASQKPAFRCCCCLLPNLRQACPQITERNVSKHSEKPQKSRTCQVKDGLLHLAESRYFYSVSSECPTDQSHTGSAF